MRTVRVPNASDHTAVGHRDQHTTHGGIKSPRLPQFTSTNSIPLTVQIPSRIVRSGSTSSEVDVTTADSWSEVTASAADSNLEEDLFEQPTGFARTTSVSSLSNLVQMNTRTGPGSEHVHHLLAVPVTNQSPDGSTHVIHIYNRLDEANWTRESVDKLNASWSLSQASPNRSRRAAQHPDRTTRQAPSPRVQFRCSPKPSSPSPTNQHRSRSQCTRKIVKNFLFHWISEGHFHLTCV
ncbi:unnamed protein product [Echinostoma caproni]|uniref:Uncharacterized protein n=1 Tax=Echinostoma caproni TaxID=27848 RepID=A0A183AWH0_9TREM|nr:unnamed protein product [Echinostoma caproni]